jgi:peptidoglycan/LPS O-acetylase OafA/YrhL
LRLASVLKASIKHMKYRPEIDGVRALAVLPVILFHAGFTAFSGGFIGVDIFFVISGYLITSIILKDLESGTFSFWEFYERRARRILPALFFVIICSIPFALMWLMPNELRAFSKSIVAVSFFVSNIFFWRQSGYFDTAAELKPLLHTWSLAVEEQFYIFFPIAIVTLWRFGRKNVVTAVALVALISLALSEYSWRHYPSFNFYWLPTRSWELAAGSLCAFVTVKQKAIRDDLLSFAGLAAIAFAIFYFDKTTPFPSLYALIPVLGTCGIILFARQGTIVGSLLSLKACVGIGLISYSAYLWHQPLFAFARIRSLSEPPWQLMLLLAGCSLVLAYFSWRYIEMPARRRGSSSILTRQGVLACSAIAAAALALFGFVGNFYKGFPDRFSPLPLASSDQFSLPYIDKGYCFYSLESISALEVGEKGLSCDLGADVGQPPKILLFGDSLAAQWEPFWDTLSKKKTLNVRSVTTNWCFPAFSESFPRPGQGTRAHEQCKLNRRYLRQNASQFEVIILGGDWDFVEREGLTHEVTDAIAFLLLSTDAKIIVMPNPVPVTRKSVEDMVNTGLRRLIVDTKRLRNVEQFESALAAMGSSQSRLVILDRKTLFGNYFGSNGLFTSEGLPYSWDGLHISIYGSLASSKHILDSGDMPVVLRKLFGDPLE